LPKKNKKEDSNVMINSRTGLKIRISPKALAAFLIFSIIFASQLAHAQLVFHNPTQAKVELQKGLELLISKDNKQAIKHFQMAIKHTPDDSAVYYAMGEAWQKENVCGMAKEFFSIYLTQEGPLSEGQSASPDRQNAQKTVDTCDAPPLVNFQHWGLLHLQNFPPGTIELDGETGFLGQTDVKLVLKPGVHHVKIDRGDQGIWEEDVTIAATKINSMPVPLKVAASKGPSKRGAGTEITKIPSEFGGAAAQADVESPANTAWWVIGVGAALIVTGIVTDQLATTDVKDNGKSGDETSGMRLLSMAAYAGGAATTAVGISMFFFTPTETGAKAGITIRF
jgi:hypothetical protein